MNPFQDLVERRIREAQQRGEMSNLPGEGEPLALDDDAMLPDELRAGYRLLKNANCLPPEIVEHAEIRRLEELLDAIDTGTSNADQDAARRRLRLLKERVAGRRNGQPLWADAAYEQALVDRMERDSDTER
jgi:hypothetical protein